LTAVDETEQDYKQFAQGAPVSGKKIEKPDSTVEKEITRIYTQAFDHRSWLVKFYIWYTVVFTLFVLGLIAWQAAERVHLQYATFEIVPQWCMNLLVTGMFVQFIGLLKIVTERVWDFKELFAHWQRMQHRDQPTPEEPETKD